MSKQSSRVTFKKTARFSVQWTSTGIIKPVSSPAFLKGENPYILKAGKVYLNVISGANLVTDKFFARAGAMFQKEFEALSKEERGKVAFPIVPFSITVSGVADPQAMLIQKGTAVATGKFKLLSGRTTTVSVSQNVSGLNASLHTGEIAFRPHEGDRDPACWQAGGYWSGCRDFGGCKAIVQDAFGGCWTTYCGWDWSYWQCGCKYNKRVPC